MTIRIVALVLAALLVIPAAALALRPRGDAAARRGPRDWLSLDGLWTVVPIVLLVALIALSVAA